jgi:hypothetical protein
MRVSWSQAWLMAKEAEGRFLRASRDEVGDALVLWCDYGADPTWRFVNDGPRVSPVSLDTLALAEATKVGLRVWARTFEDITLTWPSEAEPTKEQWVAFIREGERLRDLVRAELGPDIEVVLDHR